MAQVTKEEAYIIGAAQKRFREEYYKKKKKKEIREKVLWGLLVIVASVIVFNTGFLVYEYHGDGMSAVAEDGDIVVTNRLSFLVNKPERGEVVTVNGEDGPDLKRIVGLPGDQIDFENGDVYINGARCIESYAVGQTDADVAHALVSEGTYYVLNDDRDNTDDSRTTDVLSGDVLGSEIMVIHVPDMVQENEAYQSVRDFCKSGAEVFGNAENAILSIVN